MATVVKGAPLPAGITKSAGRNYGGQLQTVVDGLSRTALTYPASDGYDTAGRPAHTIDGLGTERRQAYDGLGRLKTHTEDTVGTDLGARREEGNGALSTVE